VDDKITFNNVYTMALESSAGFASVQLNTFTSIALPLFFSATAWLWL
jgi:hypothetical protein